MWLIRRRVTRTITRQVLVLLAGAWLASVVAPCVMVEDCCEDSDQMMAFGASETCASAALDCQLPDPNPRSDVKADTLAPKPVILAFTPIVTAPTPKPERYWTRVQGHLPLTPLNLQHARLLI